MGKPVVNIGDGLTLLHQAASSNLVGPLVHLLKAGHPTELRTSAGETALDQACWRGHTEAVMELLRYNADVDCQTNGKYTPLHRCAFYNHHRLAGLLVLAGACQTLTDEHGQTAYQVAVQQGNTEIASTLEPILDGTGNNIAGIAYATNNPKHAGFRQEARDSLFSLFEMNARFEAARTAADDDDDEDEEEEEEEEEGADAGGVGADDESGP